MGRFALEEVCVVHPLGTHASRFCHWESCSRPSPLSLHPTAQGKMAELSQGLSTFRSGKISTPFLHLLYPYYFGWSKLKQGEPPQYKYRGKQRWNWKPSCVEHLQPPVYSGTWLTAFSPTEACVWSLWSRGNLLTVLLILVLRWLSTPNLISSGSASSGGTYGTEPFSSAACSDSDMSSLQPGWETELQAEGWRKRPFPGATASAHLHFQGLPENRAVFCCWTNFYC